MKHLGKTLSECKECTFRDRSRGFKISLEKTVHLEGALREVEELLNESVYPKAFRITDEFQASHDAVRIGLLYRKWLCLLVSKTLGGEKT